MEIKDRYEWKVNTPLRMSNSFGTIRKEDNVEVECILRFRNEDRGSFELYDLKTGGDDWYAEGGLWFKNGRLRDYDGVFSLPSFIEDKLKELGYNTEEEL